MLFKKKNTLFLLFKDKSIQYMIVDAQKKDILEHDFLLMDVPVLIEGKLTNESLVQKRLELFVREKKLRNAKVHLILPDHFTIIRKEEVPIQLEESEIKDYLYLHLNSKIRLPIDKPKIDFQVINQLSDSKELLLVAYPDELVQSFQKLVESLQLYPEVADFSYLSVYRVFKQFNASDISEEDHLLLIQWHPFDSSLTVFHRDTPQFNRQTNFQRVVQNWEQKADGSWVWIGTPEELDIVIEEQINSIERYLDFYKYSIMNGEKMITSILLTGDFPDFEYLFEKIKNRIDIPLSQLKLPSEFSKEFAPLLGLTIKKPAVKYKKKRKPIREIKFLKKPFKKTVEEVDAG
ncbi:type IV pilus biogenesis protein PilM [Marinilactibacillus sp. GCM10026970]|uniref:type IV pilus biogenesis protein PilM n=1 Tax=Marinilactibacillus sp. GCM10026970 TaxID=3252642 RepID=UPI003605F1CF